MQQDYFGVQQEFVGVPVISVGIQLHKIAHVLRIQHIMVLHV